LGFTLALRLLRYHRRAILGALYLLGILSVTIVASLSVDIYMSVQLIYAEPAQPNSLMSLYLISVLTMPLSVSLFTLFDRTYYSKSTRKSVFHSTLYAMVSSLILLMSAYTQYQFNTMTFSLVALSQNLLAETLLQMALARIILFMACSPLIAYFTCALATNRHPTERLTIDQRP